MAARSAREIRGQAAGSDDDDLNLTSADCEMVLSKEEFDMLQAFHRFVPLPALSSRILRVYCEDDLQVPEASHEDTEEGGSDTRKPSPSDRGLQSDTTQSSKSGNILRHPCRPSNLRKKPHYQINLTSQTSRIQQQQQQQPAPPSSRTPSSSRSSADSERSERPEVQD